MDEMTKHGSIGKAAMKADMDRKTARKYVAAGKLPSELTTSRDWRTRPDPFEKDWPSIEAQLREAQALEAKTLFEQLMEDHPGRYEPGQLRTLQRRVARWRATAGPDREVVFGQAHRPGEAAQTDFTHATSLGVTIMGTLFPHLLCVCRWPQAWGHLRATSPEAWGHWIAIRMGPVAEQPRVDRQKHGTTGSPEAWPQSLKGRPWFDDRNMTPSLRGLREAAGGSDGFSGVEDDGHQRGSS